MVENKSNTLFYVENYEPDQKSTKNNPALTYWSLSAKLSILI